MAFKETDLCMIHGGPSGICSYRTADAKETVDTIGYFNGAKGWLHPGSFMFLTTGVGGTEEVGIAYVHKNGDDLDITDLTVVGAADAD